MMDKADFIALERKHLAQADQHIRDAETRIERQELLAGELERNGYAAAASDARALLFSMESTLMTMQGHRDFVEAEIARLTKKLN